MKALRTIAGALLIAAAFSGAALAQYVTPAEPPSFQFDFGRFLSDPNVFYVLLLVGFYLILYEIVHTGFGFAGLGGAMLLFAWAWSFRNLPVNWMGLSLVLMALALFLLEAFLPGYGLWALAGLVAMLFGSFFLFQAPYAVEPSLIVAFSILTAAITFFLVRTAIKAQQSKVLSGPEGMVGLTGEAWSDITPELAGRVSAQGTLWNAESVEEITKGEKIQIIGVNGNTLKVVKRRQTASN